MTRREKLTLAISLCALTISSVSLFASLMKSEQAKLYVYEGEYDVTNAFQATLKLALINSGDFDVLLSDVWLTVGSPCSLEADNRIHPPKALLLASKSGGISSGEFRFTGPSKLGAGIHPVCLYVETVTANGTSSEFLVGEDSITIDVDNGVASILDPDPDRWKRVLTIFSERGLRF